MLESRAVCICYLRFPYQEDCAPAMSTAEEMLLLLYAPPISLHFLSLNKGRAPARGKKQMLSVGKASATGEKLFTFKNNIKLCN